MEEYNLFVTNAILLADLAIRLALSLRIIMRKKEVSVTLALLVIILLVPFVGASLYLIIGENRLGQKRAEHAASNLPVFKNWIASLEKRIGTAEEDEHALFHPVGAQAQRVIGFADRPFMTPLKENLALIVGPLL